MSPKTAQRINWAMAIAIATMSLAALAHFGAIVTMIEAKAESVDMHENRERITVLESACQYHEKQDERMFQQLDRLELKIDAMQSP